MNYSIQKYLKQTIKEPLLDFEDLSLDQKRQEAIKIIRRTKYAGCVNNEDIVANVISALWVADCEWRPEWNINVDSNRLKFAQWELSKSTKTKPTTQIPNNVSYSTSTEKSLDIEDMLASLEKFNKKAYQVLHLRFIENRDVSEIAAKFEQSESSIYENIKKACKFLNQKFPEYRRKRR